MDGGWWDQVFSLQKWEFIDKQEQGMLESMWGGPKVQTSSYKEINSGDIMYGVVIVVNTIVFCI